MSPLCVPVRGTRCGLCARGVQEGRAPPLSLSLARARAGVRLIVVDARGRILAPGEQASEGMRDK